MMSHDVGAVTSPCSVFTISVDIVTICILVILFIVTISSSLCADWLSVESANQHFSPSTSLNLPFTAICQPPPAFDFNQHHWSAKLEDVQQKELLLFN